MKHKENCPCLNHAQVATLQPVFVLLGNIISNFNDQDFLKAGENMSHGKHARLIDLMQDNLEWLKIGMKNNSISYNRQVL